MQQQTQHLLEKVIEKNSKDAFGLSVHMTDLRVVQGAVARLMDKIDEITYKGWHEDRGMACLSILEIQDTVRLIDMAFYPLFKKMSQEVDTINIHAQELFDTVINVKTDQAIDVATKLDISSKEGWNAVAMEGNIKTFTKEFGREPDSFEEVLTYITETVARVVAADKANQEEANQTSNVVTHEEEIQNVCGVHNN